MLTLELAAGDFKNSTEAVLALMSDDMTEAEANALVDLVPGGARLFVDVIMWRLVDNGDNTVTFIDRQFRAFPSGKKLGRFIARLTTAPDWEPPRIGAPVCPALLNAGVSGVGYGRDVAEAVKAAITDFRAKLGRPA